MQTNRSVKSAILTVITVLAVLSSWEFYLRHEGHTADFDDGPELWADKRTKVYLPKDQATIFIGSSRIKYAIDIPTWRGLTGTQAVQLAMTGSSPRHILTNLAADTNFKGKLIVDVTEGLFFSSRGNIKPDEGLSYYRKRTPAQRISFELDKQFEARWVFLNESQFSLNGLLNRIPIPNRPGVIPFLDFPAGFVFNTIDRQDRMTPEFVADSNQWNQVRAIWARTAKAIKIPPISGLTLDSNMQSVRNEVDKIKSRGGEVIFTRTPSNGPYYQREQVDYPRAAYWDRLLATTGCQGIYFRDYPAIANLICPEYSHLTPKDAVIFTTTLVSILKNEKGWAFSKPNKERLP